MSSEEKKIGVFICRCGGNISDYVRVEEVAETIRKKTKVAVTQVHTFTCSEAAQKEIIEEIQKNKLQGIVIASCSPKLHLGTFREMARRAGLNPYQYIQVNIREQCSWVHPHDPDGATAKAIRLIEAGIERALNARPLNPIMVDVIPEVAIIGSGLAGLTAALSLSELNIKVHIIEKNKSIGGYLKKLPFMEDLLNGLSKKISENSNIKLYLETEVLSREGGPGQYQLRIKNKNEEILLKVGAFIVASGLKPYQPKEGEFGYGLPGVLTLEEYFLWLKNQGAKPYYSGQQVERVAFIYCVGMRSSQGPHRYCSRFCCPAALKAGELSVEKGITMQYHLFRDIRAYGSYEDIYRRLREAGAFFIRFSEKEPPNVQKDEKGLLVVVNDVLTGKEKLEIPVDLVVLVTGGVPEPAGPLAEALKLPLSADGFFAEVHPKLKPVETLFSGIYLAGCSFGPRTLDETATTAMAAAAKGASLFLKGKLELEPRVVEVLPERCDRCGKCLKVCPFGALKLPDEGPVIVEEALCKGEGACVPICPQKALQIKGFEHKTMEALIRRLAS